MCIHRLLFFPTIFVKNLCHPSHFASLSKHTRFITPSYAMFSSFSQRNYDGGNGDDYSNPVPRILSMCGEQGIKSIKQKTYIRNTLILEGVKFYLDRKCFKESADFFAEQVELYHSTIGLHLLLDFCLRSYKDEAKLAQKYETNENYEEECNQAEKEELIQSVGIESQPTEEEEKQTKEGKWEPAQKVCRHRIIRLRDICMKRLNTSEFIAHLVASLILNGYSDDALIFMLSFSINGNAFFKSLRLWKKQCDLDSLEKFAVILENAYFCHLKIAIDQRKIDKKQRKIKVVDVPANEAVESIHVDSQKGNKKEEKRQVSSEKSKCKVKEASDPLKQKRYCKEVELHALLEIWKMNFKNRRYKRVCVKVNQLDATNLVRMIDIFVESWAITAYQGKRRSKESLKKLHAFIEKNSIQISSKNTHLKRILASVSDEQVSK